MVRTPSEYGAPQATATDMYQVDPIGLLRRKFWTIVFFVICSVALAMLYYFKAPKTFESWARVYIDDRRAPTMAVDGEMTQDTTVEKYLEIINSKAVLSEALEKCDIDNMESLANAENLLLHIRENLNATPSDVKSVSGVMKIRYQSPVEEDCQLILTNILAAFDSFIKNDTENAGGDMLSTMNNLEGEQAVRYKLMVKEIEQLMQKPYVQVVDGKVYNQFEGQVSKLQEELDTKASEELKFKALKENLVEAKSNGRDIEDLVVETIQDMNEGQLGGYTTTHQKYLELRVRQQELMGEYGAEHPELVNLRKQITMVDQMRKEQLLSALRSNSDDTAEGDFYSVVSRHIENKLQLLVSHIGKLEDAIGGAKSKSLEISKDCERLATLLEERDLMRDSTFEIQDRVREFGALRGFDWQDVRVLDPATEAEQVAPSLPLSLAAGLLLGSLFGFVFSALKEMAEKTFRSSEEVSQQLGVNVVSQIGLYHPRHRDPGFKHIMPDVVSLHKPDSIPAEAFKALRTSIFFKNQQTKAKVIQFTSPSPGDGKSTVAANLATVIAQSGRTVLLIDCDLRRPSQHVRFGCPENELGVSSVLAGQAEVDDVLRDVGIHNLHFISSGPHYNNPAELLIADAFALMIEDLRESYDFIIVDTPPVLPVTDPVIISHHMDAVYMPMKIRNGVQVNAQRAIESLAMVGREVDGIIINGLSKKEASGYNYGYGNYGYGSYGGAGYASNRSSRKTNQQKRAERRRVRSSE